MNPEPPDPLHRTDDAHDLAGPLAPTTPRREPTGNTRKSFADLWKQAVLTALLIAPADAQELRSYLQALALQYGVTLP